MPTKLQGLRADQSVESVFAEIFRHGNEIYEKVGQKPGSGLVQGVSGKEHEVVVDREHMTPRGLVVKYSGGNVPLLRVDTDKQRPKVPYRFVGHGVLDQEARVEMANTGINPSSVRWKVWHPNPSITINSRGFSGVEAFTKVGSLSTEDTQRLELVRAGAALCIGTAKDLLDGRHVTEAIEELAEDQHALFDPEG